MGSIRTAKRAPPFKSCPVRITGHLLCKAAEVHIMEQLQSLHADIANRISFMHQIQKARDSLRLKNVLNGQRMMISSWGIANYCILLYQGSTSSVRFSVILVSVPTLSTPMLGRDVVAG